MVDTGVGEYNALALDSIGNAKIAYSNIYEITDPNCAKYDNPDNSYCERTKNELREQLVKVKRTELNYWQEESLKTCYNYFYRTYNINLEELINRIRTYTNCAFNYTGMFRDFNISLLKILSRGQVRIQDIQEDRKYLAQILYNIIPQTICDEYGGIKLINTIYKQDVAICKANCWILTNYESNPLITALLGNKLSCMNKSPTMPIETCLSSSDKQANIDQLNLYLGSPDGGANGFWFELFGDPPRIKVRLNIPTIYSSGYVFEAGGFPYVCSDRNREIVFDLVPRVTQTKDEIYNTEGIALVLGVEFSNNLNPTCSCWGACSTFGCQGMVYDNFKDNIVAQLKEVAPALFDTTFSAVFERMLLESGVYNPTTDRLEYLTFTNGNVTYTIRRGQ